jgi:hypothetical protein
MLKTIKKVFLIFSLLLIISTINVQAQIAPKTLPETKREELKNAIKAIKIPKPAKDYTGVESAIATVGRTINPVSNFWNWGKNAILRAVNSPNNDYRSYNDDVTNTWVQLIIDDNRNARFFGHTVATDSWMLSLREGGELKKMKEPLDGVQKVFEVAEYSYTKTSNAEDVMLAYSSFRSLQNVDFGTGFMGDITVEFPDPTGLSNQSFNDFSKGAVSGEIKPIKGLEKANLPIMQAFSIYAGLFFMYWIFGFAWELQMKHMKFKDKLDYDIILKRTIVNHITKLLGVFFVVLLIATGSLFVNSFNKITNTTINGANLCKEIQSIGYVNQACTGWKNSNHHCLNDTTTVKCAFISGGVDISLDNIVNSDTSTFEKFDGDLLKQGLFMMIETSNSMKLFVFSLFGFAMLIALSLRFIWPAIKMIFVLIFSPFNCNSRSWFSVQKYYK